MAMIEPPRVIHVKAVHELCAIGFQCLDQDMVVITHKNICVESYRVHFQGLGKQRNEFLSIVVRMKYLLFTVATTHDVIISSGELNSQRSGHMSSLVAWCNLSIVKT
jgi:hypothetical protein